jgi:hypothetical protein
LQAKAAVAALGPEGKLAPDAQAAVARLVFVGQVLGMSVPKEAKVPALPKGVDPAQAIMSAEKQFITSLAGVAKELNAVGTSLPKDAPKEAAAAVEAVGERVTDAMYAVKFAVRVAPPPAAPEKAGAAPAGAAPAGGTPPASQTSGAAPAGQAPAAPPAGK